MSYIFATCLCFDADISRLRTVLINWQKNSPLLGVVLLILCFFSIPSLAPRILCSWWTKWKSTGSTRRPRRSESVSLCFTGRCSLTHSDALLTHRRRPSICLHLFTPAPSTPTLSSLSLLNQLQLTHLFVKAPLLPRQRVFSFLFFSLCFLHHRDAAQALRGAAAAAAAASGQLTSGRESQERPVETCMLALWVTAADILASVNTLVSIRLSLTVSQCRCTSHTYAAADALQPHLLDTTAAATVVWLEATTLKWLRGLKLKLITQMIKHNFLKTFLYVLKFVWVVLNVLFKTCRGTGIFGLWCDAVLQYWVCSPGRKFKKIHLRIHVKCRNKIKKTTFAE